MSLESNDAFVNGAFPFQVEVQLPFRQKVVGKLAKFEEFVMIWSRCLLFSLFRWENVKINKKRFLDITFLCPLISISELVVQ